MVLAATVRAQGAKFDTCLLNGPLFPAEQEVKIPFFMAWKDPMAITSWSYVAGKSLPSETDITSTPSAIASSKAAKISAVPQPPDQHTLYTAIRAFSTPPLATPPAKPK